MARSEAVEIARFLIQRRFAQKDEVLEAGRRLRELQAQGTRIPFLDYLLDQGVIDTTAYEDARREFPGSAGPRPSPPLSHEPFAFSSSVVNEIDPPEPALDASFEIVGGSTRPSRRVEDPLDRSIMITDGFEMPSPRGASARPAPVDEIPIDDATPPIDDDEPIFDDEALPPPAPPARKEWQQEATVFLREPPERAAVAETILETPRLPAYERPSGRLERPSGRVDRPSTRTDRPSTRTDRPSSRMDRPSGRTDRPTWSDPGAQRLDRPSSWRDRPSGAFASGSGSTGAQGLATGESFASFRILEVQDRADLGRVFKAHDLDLDRVVQLKIMPEDAAGDESARRITGQIEILAGLDHPNVMSVYNGGTHAGSKYFTLEYIAGRSLPEFVRDEVPPPEKALGIAREVAGAVEYAHRKSLAHEDLAPENVRIDEAGNPHLVGFWKNSNDTSRDLAALGRVLYLALTGVDPADPRTSSARGPVPPDQLDPRIPAEVADLCLRALSLDPIDRFPGAAELVQEIDRCLRSLRPSMRRRKGRGGAAAKPWLRPVGIGAAALALLGLLVGGGIWLVDRFGESDPIVVDSGGGQGKDPAADPQPGDNDPGNVKDPIEKPPVVPERPKAAAKMTIRTPRAGYDVTLVSIDPTTFEKGKPERVGKTPLAGHELGAGNYLVELYLPGARPERMKFPLAVKESAYGRVEEVEIEFPADHPEDMVYVPRGPISGAASSGIVVPAYLIDKNPVTNEEYRKFVEETGVSPPPHWKDGRIPVGAERQPVTQVTYDEAWLYALWAGKRLPRARELQKATTGTDGRRYPWGSRVEGLRDHFRVVTAFESATPLVVGLYPKSESPYGCMDLVGNIVHWQFERPDAQSRHTFGGCLFREDGGRIQAQEGLGIPGEASQIRWHLLGFRCVKGEIETRSGTFEELSRLAGPGYPAEDRIEAMRRMHLQGRQQAFDRLFDIAVAEAEGESVLRMASTFYASRTKEVDVFEQVRRRLGEARTAAQRDAALRVLGLIGDARVSGLIQESYGRLDESSQPMAFQIMLSRTEGPARVELAVAEFGRSEIDAVRNLALMALLEQQSAAALPLVRRYVVENPIPVDASGPTDLQARAYQYLGMTGQVDLILDKLFSESQAEGLLAAFALSRSQIMIPFGDAIAAVRNLSHELAQALMLQYFGARLSNLDPNELRVLVTVVEDVQRKATSDQLRQISQQILQAVRQR